VDWTGHLWVLETRKKSSGLFPDLKFNPPGLDDHFNFWVPSFLSRNGKKNQGSFISQVVSGKKPGQKGFFKAIFYSDELELSLFRGKKRRTFLFPKELVTKGFKSSHFWVSQNLGPLLNKRDGQRAPL